MSVHSAPLTEIGRLLDNYFIYLFVLLVLIVFGEQRNSKRLKIFCALCLTLAATTFVKIQTDHERPCFGEPGCPTDAAFPSTHAALAFTLMIAFLNKPSYPIYLLFALFVCFTRLNLGVHTFEDIAGALPFALISYYIIDLIFDDLYQKGLNIWKGKMNARSSI